MGDKMPTKDKEIKIENDDEFKEFMLSQGLGDHSKVPVERVMFSRRDMTTEALSSQGKIIFSGVSIKPGRTIALFNIKDRPVLSVSCSGQ